MGRVIGWLLLLSVALAGCTLPAAAQNVRPLSSVQVLAQSGVAASWTGTTDEVALATVNVPGGLLGLNSAIRVKVVFTTTNSANNKTLRVRYGGILMGGQTVTTVASSNFEWVIRARGVRNSQVSFPQPAAQTTALSPITSSINSDSDQPLVISCSVALSSESCGMEGYTIELMSP